VKPKVVLLARVKAADGSYPFVRVPIKRNQPQAPQDASAYYLRYTQNGRRKVKAVGTNLEEAFIAYLLPSS
jgi:hypothetical protein